LTNKLSNRKTGYNKVLRKAGLNGFDWEFVQGSSAAADLRLNFCAKNPLPRQFANRCRQLNQTTGNDIIKK